MQRVTPLLIRDATIIDGVADIPIEGRSIWIEGQRIKAIGGRGEMPTLSGAEEIDARGQYVIPGLMNANVHLLGDLRVENLARYQGHYEELIIEAAQIALKNGLTTVFDTAGPRRFLMAVRDSIDAGTMPGARIFCAGNIIGFDGPFSVDFLPKAMDVASVAMVRRINAIWVENTGRHLLWLTPEQVAEEVRAYIAKGIDFLKYASNDHFPGAYLAFSPPTQTAIVEEAHRAGITAQAHTMSVEGLRIAIEAGCDLIQHANVTGPTAIPPSTLELFRRNNVGAVIFALTQRRLDWLKEHWREPDAARTAWRSMDVNARNLINAGAPLLYANDGYIPGPELAVDPVWSKWTGLGEHDLYDLGEGHFAWFRAMEEKGCSPLQMLRAATRNIAVAYGKDKDLGTLEPGKIADLLILNKNPLRSAENYRSIRTVIKEGVVVETQTLPVKPMLTKPLEPPVEEEAAYAPFFSTGQFPFCATCLSHR
jgi:imidazolonepropionase-like amidohydrolase